MYNKKGNVFRSSTEKVIQTNTIKKMINDIDPINKYIYYFGTQADDTIYSKDSVILTKTNYKKDQYTPPSKNSKRIEKALEILRDNNFFETLKSQKSSEDLIIDITDLYYKEMRNIKATSSLTQMEKSYKNLNSVREKGGYIIGFDTETIGAVTDKVWSPDTITEFAMKIDNVKNDVSKEVNILLTSPVNGISHQKKYEQIENLLKQKNGLELLKQDNDLYITAQRYSMYGHKDTKIVFDEDLGYAKVISFAGEAKAKPGNLDLIKAGVDKLTSEEISKAKIDEETGLLMDISQVIKSVAYMKKITDEKEGIIVNYNGQMFDIPVMNKFIKNVYEDQLKIINDTMSTKEMVENAKRAKKYMESALGEVPGFNIDNDFVLDVFPFVRASVDLHGEQKFYNTTKVGKNVLEKSNGHIYIQENIGKAFYPNVLNQGASHMAINDTNVLNSFILKNIENSSANMPLIDWIMKGLQDKGMLGITEDLPTHLIDSNQYYMSIATDPQNTNGKKIFNYLEDSTGKIVTSSNHIINKDGTIIYDKIIGENPRIFRNQFYKVKSASKINMSKLPNELANLTPEYGLNEIYHLQLEQLHSDKFKGTSSSSTLNLLFGSKNEMEAWFSSTFAHIGENKDGEFKFVGDPSQYEIRQLKNGITNLNEDFIKNATDYERFQHLMSVYEENTIDRRVVNNFLNDKKAASKIGGLLDFHEFMKKEKLDHLSSLDLAKIYFDDSFATTLGISPKTVKKIKANLKKNLGFDKKGTNEKILLDPSARNAIFAYDNIKKQSKYYKNMIDYSLKTLGIQKKESVSYSEFFNSLNYKNKKDKDDIYKVFNYLITSSNNLIVDKLGLEDNRRDVLINGKHQLSNSKQFESIFDFKLSENFYEDKKAKKIINAKESTKAKNVITFNLDRENPRQAFINSLLKEKYGRYENFNDAEKITYSKAVFYDFIKNLNSKDNPDLFKSKKFRNFKRSIENSNGNFSLYSSLEVFQNIIEKIKSKNIDAGLIKNDTIASRHVNKNIAQAKNNLTIEEVEQLATEIPTFKNLNKNKKEIKKQIEYLLDNFYMPSKDVFKSEISSFHPVNQKMANILYSNVREQMKGELDEIFKIAGYANMDIQFNKITGNINLIDGNETIPLNNIPKIKLQHGMLYAESGEQKFKLEHVLRTINTKDGPKIALGTNLDLNYGKENYLFNRVKGDRNTPITPDMIFKQIGFTRKDFSDSSTLRNFTLADYLTGNFTVDFRGADPILTEIFNPDGELKYILNNLVKNNKLHTTNIISILEEKLPDSLKKGELMPILRMLTNADISTIYESVANDEDTAYILKNTNSLGKETRIAEGKRTAGPGIIGTSVNLLDNLAKPTVVSSLNSKWIKSNAIEYTRENYKGLLVAGNPINSEDIVKNIYRHVEETKQDYVYSFAHRQLYTGVFGINEILYNEQKRVLDNFTNANMSDEELDFIYKLYNKASLQIKDSVYEQAKVLDPVLFEGTLGQVPQDVQRISKNLDTSTMLSIVKNDKKELKKLVKNSKISEMIDSIGEIVINKDNTISYKKGVGALVKRGEIITPYLAYGNTPNYVSSKFKYGVLNFSVRNLYGDELNTDEINTILNKNKEKFSDDKHDNIKTFISILDENGLNVGFEIENANKLELAKMSDSSAEKSMVRLIYGKTGEFDEKIEKYFKSTNGQNLLYGTVLTDKAIDAYINEVEKRYGKKKADKILEQSGLKSIEELKERILAEQFKYREIIFGPKGIFPNISGIANDNVVKHRSEGLRLMGVIGQAISLVGKYENNGIEDKNSYEIGLNKVLDFINNANGKFNFIGETKNGVKHESTTPYDKKDFALMFNRIINDDTEFNYLDVNKAKDLIKAINDTFLVNAKEEDKLYHTNVKVLTGKDKYETVEEYFGNLSFIKNEKGEKIANGSIGVVSKSLNLDSEFQSGISKEYLDRKKHLRELEDERYKLSKKKELTDIETLRLKKLDRKIETEMMKIEAMQDHSKRMKIDDQAKNILSLSKLNEETEKNINNWFNEEEKKIYGKLLGEATNDLIKYEKGQITINDLIRSDNVNEKLIDEIRSQITFNPLEEKQLTGDMLKDPKYSKYKNIYEQVSKMNLPLGVDHAEIFYEGIQAVKAAQFNNGNNISMETLIDKFDFRQMNIEDYVSSKGRADSPVLENLLHEAVLIDLGEDFKENRYIAVPGLGRKSGSKEIRQPWHSSLDYISQLYKEYQSFEGLDSKNATRVYGAIIEAADKLRSETDDLIKKGTLFGSMGKVEVNMPYSRVKLLSTISEELTETPLIKEMKADGKIVEDFNLDSFRNKAIINGKTIAEWEKGGVEGKGIFFDYRIAGIGEFENAGYFDEKFMSEVMGFKRYVNSQGKTVTARDQMIDYLETYGTMDLVDRYPNIKDQSIFTSRTFLSRNLPDNATALAAQSLLKINGDSDGDMVSSLFLEYKDVNFASYNKQRLEAERFIRNKNKLSDVQISSEEFEQMVKAKTISSSKGRISPEAYDFFRGKEIETVYRAVENRKIAEESLLPSFYKESSRNYKNMALSITKDGKETNLLAEVVGGKSVLGEVRPFALEHHVESGFFIDSTNKLSKHMEIAFENKDLMDLSEYKYIQQMGSKTNIHEFGNNQTEALDEVLAILKKASEDKNNSYTKEMYEQAEKDIFDRIRANTYIEAEMSKSSKEAIGQVNAALYPLRQTSELYFGRPGKETYNERTRQIISDMSEQIEQNIISYKHVKVEVGDKRLSKFVDIMKEAKINKGFNTLKGSTQDRLIDWTSEYLSDDIINKMYSNVEKNLTDELLNRKSKYYDSFLKQGFDETQADSRSKIRLLTEEYIQGINELYSSKNARDNIALFSSFGRSSSKVTNMSKLEYADEESFNTVVSSIIYQTNLNPNKKTYIADHRNTINQADEAKSLNDYIRSLNESHSNESKKIANKVIKDAEKSVSSSSSSGIALGVLGLASGLLISGFAGGNPLRNANPQDITEENPNIEAMSVPDFFENQSGYVTGNSQRGYVLNIKADTDKGQRHMKRALKEAVRSSAGGAVSINMNFKSNNSGGYSDRDIENIISNYI